MFYPMSIYSGFLTHLNVICLSEFLIVIASNKY